MQQFHFKQFTMPTIIQQFHSEQYKKPTVIQQFLSEQYIACYYIELDKVFTIRTVQAYPGPCCQVEDRLPEQGGGGHRVCVLSRTEEGRVMKTYPDEHGVVRTDRRRT